IALDLIDRMLKVDPDKRTTVDECLENPWTTQKYPSASDSTNGLTGAMRQLDCSRRKHERERTLLASIKGGQVDTVVPAEHAEVKVFRIYAAANRVHNTPRRTREPSPSAERRPDEFIRMGGRGDPALFDEDPTSNYAPTGV